MADRFLTIADLAAALRVSDETARKIVTDGHVSGFQIRGPGSAWRVDIRSFRAYINKSRNVIPGGDDGEDS